MAFSTPVFLKDDAALPVERVSLSAGEGMFNERWLQETLFRHPQSLPIADIAPYIRDLVPLCMELKAGDAGYVDILYVTEHGELVVVETKLWRNMEARRTVVVQILDYAKELVRWTYEDLAREVAVATRKGPDYLFQLAKARWPHLQEATFVDNVNRGLKRGEFVLLIVGDGIRSGAESLVSFVEQYGSLRFTLGLIEAAAFQFQGGILLQPRVLAKAEVIRLRALAVPADTGAVEDESAAVQEELDPVEARVRQWQAAFWADYLQRLTLDDKKQPVPQKPPRDTNLYLPQPPSGGTCWISPWASKWTNRGGIYISWLKQYPHAKEIYEALVAQREEIEREVGMKLEWSAQNDKFRIGMTKAFGDLEKPACREEALRFLNDVSNRFVNTFRHRLDGMERARQEAT